MARVTDARGTLHVQVVRGTIAFEVVPQFVVPGTAVHAGGLTAPMPGSIVQVRVAPGDRVEAGAVLVVMEAMKMEHHIVAPSDGHIAEVYVTAGEQVENGTALLLLEPDDDQDV